MYINNFSLFIAIFLLFLWMPFSNQKWFIRINSALIYPKNIYLKISFVFLFIFMGFRGDFSTDYINYVYAFRFAYPRYTIVEIGNADRDIGFVLLNKVLYSFSQQYITLFLACAAIICYFYYLTIKKESVNYFLSILLFSVLDNYLISNNLMSQIVAVSMYVYICRFIWEEKPIKYILGVLFISTMLRATIVLLPVYWILRIDYRKKNNAFLLVAIFAVFMLFMSRYRSTILFVQKIIGYNWDIDAYGVSGGSPTSFLKTIGLTMIIFLLYFKINFLNVKERVWFNGCIMALLFHFLSLYFFMMQRMAFYFSGFFFLLIPLLISRLDRKKYYIFCGGITLFCIIYSIAFRGDFHYYLYSSSTLGL